MTQLNSKWQKYFANMALAAATGSKDTSTKVGAVIYRPDRSTCSTGFNGLPRHIPDDPWLLMDREWKLKHIIHAEQNAIDYAVDCLKGYGMVVTHHPCSKCAVKIVESGLSTVYYIPGLENSDRWRDDMTKAKAILECNGVACLPIDAKKG